MFRRLLLASAAICSGAFAAPAFANHQYTDPYDDWYDGSYYDDDDGYAYDRYDDRYDRYRPYDRGSYGRRYDRRYDDYARLPGSRYRYTGRRDPGGQRYEDFRCYHETSEGLCTNYSYQERGSRRYDRYGSCGYYGCRDPYWW